MRLECSSYQVHSTNAEAVYPSVRQQQLTNQYTLKGALAPGSRRSNVTRASMQLPVVLIVAEAARRV